MVLVEWWLLSPRIGQPCCEPAVTGFHGVVGVSVGDVAGCREQLVDDARVGPCPVSADLDRHHTDLLPRLGEERSGGVQVPALGRQDLDDLAVLIDGPVQVVPCPGDLDVGFVDEPPIPRCAGRGGRRR